MEHRLYGALEAGGTKMVAAIYEENGNLVDRTVVKTQSPRETVGPLVEFFGRKELTALGIGAFGPVNLHEGSEDYGRILRSPKKAWEGFSFYKTFQETLHCPVVIDTDVNAALLGEVHYGALKGIQNGIYLTVGTGIGAGIMVNGRLLHGLLHSEAGHILVSRLAVDAYEGCCPYHSHCLEGLASGPAVFGRTGRKGDELPPDHPVWEMISSYLAEALADYILILSPERIVLGGGVMKQEQLFPMIRRKVAEDLAGYLTLPEEDRLCDYLVPAGAGGDQGILGAFRLAADAIG